VIVELEDPVTLRERGGRVRANRGGNPDAVGIEALRGAYYHPED
jgi:hypothetical protein